MTKKHNKKNLTLYLFLAILIVGIFLRLYSMIKYGFWLDEITSAKIASQSLLNIAFNPDTSPPLYFIFLHFWIKLFSFSELSIRSLSVVFSILNLPLIYLISKKLFDKNTAIISTFITSFSPIHIYFANEARTYSLTFFLSLLSMYLFINIIKENLKQSKLTIKNINLTAYTLVNVFLIYSHIYAIMLPMIQCFFVLILNKDLKNIIKKFSISMIITIIAFIPWIINLIRILKMNHFNWIPKTSPKFLVDYITNISLGYTFPIYGYIIEALFLFIIIFYIRTAYAKKRWETLLLLTSWAFLPVLSSFLFSILIIKNFTAKYIIMYSFPIYIMVAKGSIDLFKTNIIKKNKVIRYTISSILIISLILLTTTIFIQKNTLIHQPWKETINYINTNRNMTSPEEPVAIIANYETLSYAYHSDNKCIKHTNDYLFYDCLGKEGIMGVNSIEDYEKFLKSYRRISNKGNFWLIISNAQYLPKDLELIKKFDTNFDLISSKNFYIQKSDLFKNKENYFFNKISTLNSTEDGIQVKYYEQK